MGQLSVFEHLRLDQHPLSRGASFGYFGLQGLVDGELEGSVKITQAFAIVCDATTSLAPDGGPKDRYQLNYAILFKLPERRVGKR